MFKTLIIGIFLGVIGAGAVVYFVPAVDLHRERSLIDVQPNGGNREVYRINLPRDRLLVGLSGSVGSIPAGLEWPGEELLGDMQAELFKVRNRNNTVIGIASRLASSTEETGPFIEWALHFPARGTIYAQMELSPSVEGHRDGKLRSGTRDFEELTGTVREQFIAGEAGNEESQGQIELQTILVAPLGEIEEDTDGDLE
ncbi:MAG: hypothetical protein ACR2Q3_02225 [Woeseiaceae bacterium]